jgi:DNA polymerase-3 subunit delta'
VVSLAEPLPWLAEPLLQALQQQRGHALLVHAAPGNGALHFALSLAQAWLCEAGDGRAPACGQCGSCRMLQGRLHPDAFVLLPEALRRQHEWPLVDDKPEGDDAKRKPSRQIRIDEVRALIDWSTRTTARGRGKVALLHPAEQLNPQAANALLKTLEEPPAGTRLVLSCADPALLLPTVRSRCQVRTLPTPPRDVAERWLATHGVRDGAAALLAACSGRPLDALALHAEGVDAAAWAAVPRAVAAGQPGVLAGWPLPRALDALLKLCHDALARAGGAGARYFADADVPAGADPARLADWSRELLRVARFDEHPWHEALLLESLLRQGARALAPREPTPGARGQGPLATLPAR